MKKAVLLIEDNILLTKLYEAGLKREGLEVVVAHNGEEGLNAISEHLPDMILLDLNMPLMGGVQVLEAIRSNPKTKDLKVIVITISAKDGDEEKVKALGVYDYIVKSETDLDQIVNRVLACLDCKV